MARRGTLGTSVASRLGRQMWCTSTACQQRELPREWDSGDSGTSISLSVEVVNSGRITLKTGVSEAGAEAACILLKRLRPLRKDVV